MLLSKKIQFDFIQLFTNYKIHQESNSENLFQLNELRDARLPPPACGQGRRRRMSVASSQAALAGSGHAYVGSSGSRCHSALGHYGLEPELWLARRMSMTQSELLNEVNLSPCSTNKR